MAQVGAAYDSFDREFFPTFYFDKNIPYVPTTHSHQLEKRNEVAHALYSTQLCFGKGDKLSNTQISLSTLVSDEIVHFESGLSMCLGIWGRLLADSTEIYHWLKNPSKYVCSDEICYLSDAN